MSVKFSESVKEERSVPLVEGQKKLHRTCDALAESQKKRVSRAAQELGAGGRDSRQKVRRDQYHRACSRFYEEFR